jgi:AI-2 transport protein TqsA
MEPAQAPGVEQRIRTVCLLVLATVAVGATLMLLRTVLVPFVLALFLSTALVPLLDFLHRRFRFPRGLAIASAAVFASAVLLFLVGLVSSAVTQVLAKDDVYITQVTRLIGRGEEAYLHWEERLGSALHLWSEPEPAGPEPAEVEPAEVEPQDPPPGAGRAAARQETGTPASPLDGLERRVPELLTGVISWVVNTGLSLVSQGAIVLVFLVFLILGYRPPEDRDPTTLWAQLRRQINEYVRVKAIVSLVTGLLTFLILRWLGVDLALVFGTMAFFLNFIPNIGSFVAMLLPLPIVVLAPPEQLSLAEKLLAFAGPGAVQLTMGNLVEPRWMGRSLDLHPVVVLLSLIFWGYLWGPIGMLLSVPITSVLKTLAERVDLTRPLADLLDNED